MSGPPTFMQNAAVTQERCPATGAGAVDTALGTTDQLEALTCAGTVRPCGWAAGAPPGSTSRRGSAIRATAQPAIQIRIKDRISRTSHTPLWGRSVSHVHSWVKRDSRGCA